MRPFLFIAVPLLAVLSGCATAVDKTYQVVEVVTPGVIGADCTLKTSGNQYRVITPTKAQIQRSEEALEIECRKAGYLTALVSIEPQQRIGRASILNGFNGILPGTGYDIASRAVFRYPATISVQLEADLAAAGLPADPSPGKLMKKREGIGFDPEALAPEKTPADRAISGALKK